MGLKWRVVRASLIVPVGGYLLLQGGGQWLALADFLDHAAPATTRIVGSQRNVAPNGSVSYGHSSNRPIPATRIIIMVTRWERTSRAACIGTGMSTK